MKIAISYISKAKEWEAGKWLFWEKECCSPVKLRNIIMMHNDVKAQFCDKAQFDDNVQFDVNLQFDDNMHHQYLKYVGFYVKRR